MRLPIWFRVEENEVVVYIDLSEEADRRAHALGQICFALGHLLPVDVDLFIISEVPSDTSNLITLNRWEETDGEMGRRTREWASTLKTVVRELYRLRGIRDWTISLDRSLDSVIDQLGGGADLGEE